MFQKRFLAVLGAILLVLAACGPAATPTSAPARATPTSAPAPTATLSPVATSVVTPTPKPSLTPTPAVTQPSGPKMGGIVRWAAPADPTGPDPHRFTRNDVYDYINHIHTRLLRFNATEKGCGFFPLEPELATKWDWVNDKTLEVTLRQGVKFQPRPPVNGREVTAEDVVYVVTNQWPKTSQLASQLKSQLANVQALDSYKVRFNFKMPAPEFLSAVLAYAAALITPKEVFGPKGDIERLEDNVGLGPYMLKQYVPGVKFEFEKSPNYFREGIPRLDGMVASIMPDFSTRFSSLRAGKLDYLMFTGMPTLVQEAQRTAPHLQVVTCPYSSPMTLNVRSDTPPFNDVRVRRAIAMAINRDVLVKTTYLGRAMPVWTTMTPAFSQYYMDIQDFPAEVRPYLEYHPDRAKQLLAEAGYPRGFTTSIRASPAYPEQVPVAEGIVAMLAQVGITASLEMVERARYTETVYTSKFPEMSISWMHSGDSLDAILLRALATGGGNNHSAISDAETDRMLSELQVATDPKRTVELVRALQIRQVEQAWYVQILQPENVLMAQPYIKVPSFKTGLKQESDYLMYMWRD